MARGSGSPSSSSAGSRTTRVVVTTLAVATAGGLVLVLSQLYRQKRGGGSSSKSSAISFPASEKPREATTEALERIRTGRPCTVGELVCFLRGPANDTFPGKKHTNAYTSRFNRSYINFLVESYLPATAKEAASDTTAERSLFVQLVACDHTLRRLEHERATSFDNANREHVNLLQQLWMACGKPANSFARTGKQWGELGFQGEDPVTDLRGGGVLALRQLVHFAQSFPTAMKEMMAYNKTVQDAGEHSWYLIAVVSIQFTAQLLLQQDHPFYAGHLEVLYDTVNQGQAKSGGGAGTRAVPRRQLAEAAGCVLSQVSSPAVIEFWNTTESDAEAGMLLLHHALLLHFKACWERDTPHVMEYNTYMPQKVFSTFFTEKWALPADLAGAKA